MAGLNINNTSNRGGTGNPNASKAEMYVEPSSFSPLPPFSSAQLSPRGLTVASSSSQDRLHGRWQV